METRIASPSRTRTSAVLLAALVCSLQIASCDPDRGKSDTKPQDPHVVRDGRDVKPDRSVVSPITLRSPIYACANTVVAYGYAPNTKVTVRINGADISSGSTPTTLQLTISVPSDFIAGQRITAVQEIDGVTSDPSNEVTVISHTQDYPAGPLVSTMSFRELG
jgi:hypothetical protein